MTDDEETHIFMYIDNVHTETTNCIVNFLKFDTHFFFFSQIHYFSGLEITNCLSEKQTGKTLIRLLLQKQSDLGLSCLSRPFWQATRVQNF